jgi:hypothetical protein
MDARKLLRELSPTLADVIEFDEDEWGPDRGPEDMVYFHEGRWNVQTFGKEEVENFALLYSAS